MVPFMFIDPLSLCVCVCVRSMTTCWDTISIITLRSAALEIFSWDKT